MIIIGSDHAGFTTKEFIKKELDRRKIPYMDCGCDGSSVDYPDIAEAVCRKVLKGTGAADTINKGVLICGTGIGISISANKINGIRAALVGDCYSAKMARLHNDSNVICLGGRTLGEDVSWELLTVWLNSEFIGERHSARIDKITVIEEKEKENGVS
jgi:ribose 5-phosphate isomerase B